MCIDPNACIRRNQHEPEQLCACQSLSAHAHRGLEVEFEADACALKPSDSWYSCLGTDSVTSQHGGLLTDLLQFSRELQSWRLYRRKCDEALMKFNYKPVSQSCAVAKSEKFWWTTLQSNLQTPQQKLPNSHNCTLVSGAVFHSVCQVWLSSGPLSISGNAGLFLRRCIIKDKLHTILLFSCEDNLSDKCAVRGSLYANVHLARHTILVTQSLGRKIAWRARRTCASPTPCLFCSTPSTPPCFATPTFNWRSYGSKREVLVVHQTSF